MPLFLINIRSTDGARVHKPKGVRLTGLTLVLLNTGNIDAATLKDGKNVGDRLLSDCLAGYIWPQYTILATLNINSHVSIKDTCVKVLAP